MILHVNELSSTELYYIPQLLLLYRYLNNIVWGTSLIQYRNSMPVDSLLTLSWLEKKPRNFHSINRYTYVINSFLIGRFFCSTLILLKQFFKTF